MKSFLDASNLVGASTACGLTADFSLNRLASFAGKAPAHKRASPSSLSRGAPHLHAVLRLISEWHTGVRELAERGFDPRTFGL